MSGFLDWYERHRHDIRLGGYLLLTLLPGVVLADMLSRALVSGGLRVVLTALFSLVGQTSLALSSLLFGLYLGFLVLLYIDFKKRVQSLILGSVTLLTVIVLAINGRFVPNMDGIDLALLGVGLLAGIIVAGGAKLHYLEWNDARDLVRGRVITKSGRTPLEFRDAERYVYVMIVALIVVSFLEAHLQYPAPLRVVDGEPVLMTLDSFSIRLVDTDLIPRDGVAVTLFSVALWLFLGYDTDKRLFILGPPGSGKTHVPIGMYLAATHSDLHVWGARKGLNRLIREMRADQNFADRTTPDDIENIGFNYSTTGYFPRNVLVDAVDYPGEYLVHIPDGLRYLRDEISKEEFKHRIVAELESGEATKDTGRSPRRGGDSGASHATSDGGIEQPVEEDDANEGPLDATGAVSAEPSRTQPPANESVVDVEQAVETRFEDLVHDVLPRIQSADTLLLVLDMERFTHDEQLYMSYYNEIMNELQVVGDSPSAHVQGFFGHETALGPLKAEKVVATKTDFLLDEVDMSATQVMGSYDVFRKRVYNVSQNDIEVGPLLNSLDDVPYPVFFKGTDEDRYQLEFGPDGSPIIFGFRELLERLSR